MPLLLGVELVGLEEVRGVLRLKTVSEDECVGADGDLVGAEPSDRLTDRLVVLAGGGDHQVSVLRAAGPRSELGADERFRFGRPRSVMRVNLPIVNAADSRLREVRFLNAVAAYEGAHLTQRPVI